jgi:hypothetical protein
MSQFGNWNGVMAGGASNVETQDRQAQNLNFRSASQRRHVLEAFNGPSLGL